MLPLREPIEPMIPATRTIAQMISKSEADALSAELAHAREVFQAFDADGSGTIGADELGDMLSALDIDASDEEAAALFRYLDSDGTGGVSFDEFLPWYSETAESAKQSAEVFQGIIMSRRTVDSFDKTEIDQAVVKRAIECAIAAPVSKLLCILIYIYMFIYVNASPFETAAWSSFFGDRMLPSQRFFVAFYFDLLH